MVEKIAKSRPSRWCLVAGIEICRKWSRVGNQNKTWAWTERDLLPLYRSPPITAILRTRWSKNCPYILVQVFPLEEQLHGHTKFLKDFTTVFILCVFSVNMENSARKISVPSALPILLFPTSKRFSRTQVLYAWRWFMNSG